MRGHLRNRGDLRVGVAEGHVRDDLPLRGRQPLIHALQARGHAARRAAGQRLAKPIHDREGRDEPAQQSRLGAREAPCAPPKEHQRAHQPFPQNQMGEQAAPHAQRPRDARDPGTTPDAALAERLLVGDHPALPERHLVQAAQGHGVVVPVLQRAAERHRIEAHEAAALEGGARRELVQEGRVARDHLTDPFHDLASQLGQGHRRDPEREQARNGAAQLTSAWALLSTQGTHSTNVPYALGSPARRVETMAPIDTADALYPFTPRQFPTPDGTLSYLDERPSQDEGRHGPLLFVHGTPSWSFEWRHAIEGLRGEARCVAPDHLGFGRSDKPSAAPLEPVDHARRLRALVERLDLRDLTLVVHDFGGPIGLPLALDAPDRIRQVVVINSWMWNHGDRKSVARMSRLVASPLGRLLYRGLNASPRWLIPMSFGDRRKLTKAAHASYLRPFARRADRQGPWVLGRALAGADPYYRALWERREALRRLPLTLIWGLADPAFGPAYLARWRETFPHATVHELPGVGHFPQEEAPTEVLNALRAALRPSASRQT